MSIYHPTQPAGLDDEDYVEWVGGCSVVGELDLDIRTLSKVSVLAIEVCSGYPAAPAIVLAFLLGLINDEGMGSEHWGSVLERIESIDFIDSSFWRKLTDEQRLAAWKALAVCDLVACEWVDVQKVCANIQHSVT